MTDYLVYAPNISFSPTNFQDKDQNVENIIKRFYARTSSLFVYENLPETIPADVLELYLQHGGGVSVDMNDGDLVINELTFSGSGRDINGRPKQVLIVNPYQQNPSREKTINVDAVVMKNDTMMLGLNDIISKYATLLAENELSMWMGIINSRIMSLMIASDDSQKKALDLYLAKIQAGELTAIMDDNIELSSITVQPYSNSSFQNQIIQMTEAEQYLIGSLYIELGIKGHYNTKRENISEAESQMGDDTLIPLIDDMLKNRKEAIAKVNEIFGTEISVELGSVWKDTKIAGDLDKLAIIAEIEDLAGESEEIPEDAEETTPEDETAEETPEDTEETTPEDETTEETPEPEQSDEEEETEEPSIVEELIDVVVEEIAETIIEEEPEDVEKTEGSISKLLRKWRAV